MPAGKQSAQQLLDGALVANNHFMDLGLNPAKDSCEIADTRLFRGRRLGFVLNAHRAGSLYRRTSREPVSFRLGSGFQSAWLDLGSPPLLRSAHCTRRRFAQPVSSFKYTFNRHLVG